MTPRPHQAQRCGTDPGVPLDALLAVLPSGGRLLGDPPRPDGWPTIVDVTHDSREAGPGVLFACRPGARADGHEFGPAAVEAGAAALLVERPLALDVPQLQASSVAEALGPVAARVHGEPSGSLLLCGVTGTNGKTTSAYLFESVLRRAGHRTGLVGTVQTLVDGEPTGGVRTTPEATDLQRLLRRMVDRGVTAAAMEVSSHGLALGRVAGTRFRVALFTNLSQDHLDFHTDMEDYFAAKRRLFEAASTSAAAVNVDDPYGRRLVNEAAGSGLEVLRVSATGSRDADLVAEEVVMGADGSRFTAVLAGARVEVRTPLVGDFNVANALGVLGGAALAGIDLGDASAGIEDLAGVPGRMERVEAGQPFTVLVDYAHTPDSLDRVLRAARGLAGGRVIVVVGCGGDRDRGKRPLMGRAAAERSDLAVFTSDNPRSEDPTAIIDAMVAGAAQVGGARGTAPRVVADRRAAIAVALDEARPGDVVVIAGKGHEAVQEFADRTVDFDDREVARGLLEGQA